ncbi:hypothetical protein LSCM1_00546 [Leishmania martiniquensis]|uniref:VHS domain-containing protein n=1 Tax=Leishmania martiniquensis TaxID=1580590 RepID=A0A836KG67_9TRYP|nr:hypothetical protein LSCM1_00546 [Leishmania martiniquensis]
MVQLSFIEEIKDRASRLVPTPYMEIVEECTAPHLLIPTYEHVKFLCETVNRKPEAVSDVVRALRRRIADSDVAVKHLTVQLLESMIKNSSTSFHLEVASQKGLLRDLVAVACMRPTTGRAMQAKEAALLLTLNLSIWFRGHPAEESYILTTLADDVRSQMGPNCFEGLEPERSARMRVQVGTSNRHRERSENRTGDAPDKHAARVHGHRHDRRNVVDAIPIDLPTPERISAMLDACMAFSEYVNNAEINSEVHLRDDDVVQSYLSQVREDHVYATILLSSNLQLDRDLLRTVTDSQSAVLAKVERLMTRPRVDTAAETQPPLPPAQQPTLVSAAGDTDQGEIDPPALQAATIPPRAAPPRAEVLDGNVGVASSSPAPVAESTAVAAPSVEDLFGDMQSAPQATASISMPLEPSTVEIVPIPVPPHAAPHEETATPTAPAVGDVAASAPAPLDAAAPPSPTHAEVMKKAETEAEVELVQPQSAAAESGTAVDAAQVTTTATAISAKDEDDFDAFLEGRTGN